MPSTNQYDPRRLVYVKPFASAGLNYGFMTNCKTTTGTILGHTIVAGNSITNAPANTVIGANAPKPGRASKLIGDEYEGSFYNFDKADDLRRAKWRLTNPKIRRGSSSTRSKVVFITIGSDEDGDGGIKYAWNMPIGLYNGIASDRSNLGIQDATRNTLDLVWGLTAPRPKRAQKEVTTGTGASTQTRIYETFVDPGRTAALPDGWSFVSESGAETINPGA